MKKQSSAKDITAKWIGYQTGEYNQPRRSKEVGLPSPYLRKVFHVSKPVQKAVLISSALGVYKAYANGNEVSDDFFSPEWSDYNKLLYYQQFDIASMIQIGENCIGAVLGDGWYAGNVAFFGRFLYDQYPLGFLAQLDITYCDGSIERIETDLSWKCGTGEIVFSDMLMGECVDHNLTQKDWNSPVFDESKWEQPILLEYDKDKLRRQTFPSIKINLTLTPVSSNKLSENKIVYNMGQNMVGNVRMTLEGEKGSKVLVKYGEMLNADGTVYTENLRSAKCTDIYILSGEGAETFFPLFTYHGFQYVEIVCENCNVVDLIGCVIYTSLEQTSDFHCDSELVNKLYSNILWGQRGNFFSVPTDCPQRDERMGWTADAQVFARTASYNMDTKLFYEKYMADISLAQNEDGAVCNVAPEVEGIEYGSAAWGDACVIIPYHHYLFYGDKSIITDNLDCMEKWIAYLKENSVNYICPEKGFGDWLATVKTPKEVISTAYFSYVSLLLSKMCGYVGEHEKEQIYYDLFMKIKEAYIDKFISSDGTVLGNTQTSYLLTLQFDLFNNDQKKAIVKKLVDSVYATNTHLTTGFLGVEYLLPTLSDYGYNELAYTILLNDTYPSWGYSIKNGATTIWERWNSYTVENGFGDSGMNSFNHYSLGSVGEWMMGYMGGIRICEDNIAMSKVIIKPELDPLKRIENVAVSYKSRQGTIMSQYSISDDNTVCFKVTLPENLDGTIYLPNGESKNLSSGDNQFEICFMEK